MNTHISNPILLVIVCLLAAVVTMWTALSCYQQHKLFTAALNIIATVVWLHNAHSFSRMG